MKNKKVLVTGGAGFIGSNLVKELSKNNSVITLDNLMSGHLSNIKYIPNTTFFFGDVRTLDDVESAMRDVDVVFHLAASVGNKRSIDYPMLDAEINVMGTLNILETARKYGIKNLVLSSSAGIFGELKTFPIKEDHPVEPDTPYGCTKLCEEKLGLSYAKLYNMNIVCLRYFNVYGPNQRYDEYGNVIPKFVFQMLKKQDITVYGDGEQTRDFVNVKDVVQANIRAVQDNLRGAFNIASGTRVSINNLIQILRENHNDKITVKYVNERPGDVKHSLADISLARTKLHYSPQVGLSEGMKEYIEWAKTI